MVLRSVRKSIKDYLIYMLTLILCVSLFYAFLSISSKYYKPMVGEQYDITILSDGMKMIICVITCLIVFLVKYVNEYMLRRKKREYAILAVIGMERRVIAQNFFSETLIMGVFSIIVGIFAGSFISQMISAMLLKVYRGKYQFELMFYPDTIWLTVLFFVICFCIVGLMNYRTLCKIRIIEMLKGEKENENSEQLGKGIRIITYLFYAFTIIIVKNAITDLYYYDVRYSLLVKAVFIGNLLFPCLTIIIGLIRKIRQGKNDHLLLMIFVINILCTIIFIAWMPIIQNKYNFGFGSDATIPHILFLVVNVVYAIFLIFHMLAHQLVRIRGGRKKITLHKDNLFLLGQISSKLGTNTRAMSLISITMLLAVIMFIMLPLLDGWMFGYLDTKTTYAIQMYSRYNKTYSLEEVKDINYTYIEELLESYNLDIEWSVLVESYLLEEEQFFERQRQDFPVLAISLSDYNALRYRNDLSGVVLENDEFLMQWQSLVTEKEIEEHMVNNQFIRADEKTLHLASTDIENSDIGESIYNNYTDVVYVLPDEVCEDLIAVNYNYYIDTKIPVAYQFALRLEDEFHKQYGNQEDGVQNYIRIATLQENSVYRDSFILRASLTYSAIVLLVICFTILALQQLYDASNYKARFDILYRLGVDRKQISTLIFKQIFFWFGVPVLIATLFSLVFGVYFFSLFSMQIDAYVGGEQLLIQISKIMIILVMLLLVYFEITKYLFKRTISPLGNCRIK